MPRNEKPVTEKAQQNRITHVVFALDASSSMDPHAKALVKVADGEIAHLAQRSKELNHETRVSVYTFTAVGMGTYGTPKIDCVIYDMDVLRLPSIAGFYKPYGWTPLVDATLTALDDLAMTPEKHGDHAFLVYVLIDGQENASTPQNRQKLEPRLKGLPENWTIAALVPDDRGVYEAKRWGFPAGNITKWNPNAAQGVEEAGATIRQATDAYLTARSAKGSTFSGTKSLFATGITAVNQNTVAAAGLELVPPEAYTLTTVTLRDEVRNYVRDVCGRTFHLGDCYYELVKTETIQPQKNILLLEKKTGKVYRGPQARTLIGLSDTSHRGKPEANPEYAVLVQSTAANRKIGIGEKLLIMNR